MPTVLQFRRGTTAQNDSFTGAAGEISVDTDTDSLRIHDGSTAGGYETVARQAKYADVAERYHADAVYAPGTVVEFGGDAEITAASIYASTRVAGIISTDPFIIMNSPHREPGRINELHPPLALAGRVPCRVIGTCTKGDLMVSSNTPGCAVAWKETPGAPTGAVIGKALENKTTDDEGIIEVVAGVR